MVRYLVVLLLSVVANATMAQYCDTLTVSQAHIDSAFSKTQISRFDYLCDHVDPQIIYAQLYYATNGFNPKLMKHHNPFHMRKPNGRERRFKGENDAMARFVLAMADYDMQTESYTDYLERKPKSNWSPAMSKKLLEIFQTLYGYEYDYRKQKVDYDPKPFPLIFANVDSIDIDNYKGYSRSYAVSRTDRNIIMRSNYLGPLAVLAAKVDTQLVFTQVLWATDHFNPKLIKHNNLFQLLDADGKLMRFKTVEDCVADFLLRILDYDKSEESWLAYLERRSRGTWTTEDSDKLRKIYKSLYHKDYDERFFTGFVDKRKHKRGKVSRAKSRLLSDE